MPDMDGLETTSRIRRMEGEMTARPVYLVAMTASALAEEKEECFAAGMDNHLAKPVRRDTLRKVLRDCRKAMRRGSFPTSKRKDPQAAEALTRSRAPREEEEEEEEEEAVTTVMATPVVRGRPVTRRSAAREAGAPF